MQAQAPAGTQRPTEFEVSLARSHFPAVTLGALIDRSIGDELARAAAEAGDALALREVTVAGTLARQWTWAELYADARRLATALAGRHRPGERIAVWAHNLPEWVLIEYAAALAGLVLVTINPSFQAKEVKYVLDQSGAVALYLVRSVRGNPMWDIAARVVAETPAIRDVIDLEDHAALYAGADPARPLPQVGPRDPAQIQYTSGTTGFPKGAKLHHMGLINAARVMMDRLGAQRGDVWMNFMPMFHTSGCGLATLGCLANRITMLQVALFDPHIALDTAERERVTHLVGVPTMLVAMLGANAVRPRDLSSVRALCSGGSMVPPELVRQIKDTFGVWIQIIYGQTEASPTITLAWASDTMEDLSGTIGQPTPHTEVAIRDVGDGSIVPCGHVGEICARGYNVMLEYHDNPEATAKTIDAEGWLHTGDLGTMDARGYVRITGRVKEMIIRGGENLFPAEIENAMLEHPALAEVAVVGIPDPKWGEIVACFMKRRGAETPDRDSLVRFCRERLSPQKTPAHWIYLEDWPLTGSGKIQKFVLRDRFVAGELTAI